MTGALAQRRSGSGLALDTLVSDTAAAERSTSTFTPWWQLTSIAGVRLAVKAAMFRGLFSMGSHGVEWAFTWLARQIYMPLSNLWNWWCSRLVTSAGYADAVEAVRS